MQLRERERLRKEETNLSMATALQNKSVNTDPWIWGSYRLVFLPPVPVSDEPREKGYKLGHTNSKINYLYFHTLF